MKVTITNDQGEVFEQIQKPDAEILSDPKAGGDLADEAAEAIKREANAFWLRTNTGITTRD